MAAVDVNVEGTHENDKRKTQMVVQIYRSWLSTDVFNFGDIILRVGVVVIVDVVVKRVIFYF